MTPKKMTKFQCSHDKRRLRVFEKPQKHETLQDRPNHNSQSLTNPAHHPHQQPAALHMTEGPMNQNRTGRIDQLLMPLVCQ